MLDVLLRNRSLRAVGNTQADISSALLEFYGDGAAFG